MEQQPWDSSRASNSNGRSSRGSSCPGAAAAEAAALGAAATGAAFHEPVTRRRNSIALHYLIFSFCMSISNNCLLCTTNYRLWNFAIIKSVDKSISNNGKQTNYQNYRNRSTEKYRVHIIRIPQSCSSLSHVSNCSKSAFLIFTFSMDLSKYSTSICQQKHFQQCSPKAAQPENTPLNRIKTEQTKVSKK